jgi:hypothetical protein
MFKHFLFNQPRTMRRGGAGKSRKATKAQRRDSDEESKEDAPREDVRAGELRGRITPASVVTQEPALVRPSEFAYTSLGPKPFALTTALIKLTAEDNLGHFIQSNGPRLVHCYRTPPAGAQSPRLCLIVTGSWEDFYVDLLQYGPNGSWAGAVCAFRTFDNPKNCYWSVQNDGTIGFVPVSNGISARESFVAIPAIFPCQIGFVSSFNNSYMAMDSHQNDGNMLCRSSNALERFHIIPAWT